MGATVADVLFPAGGAVGQTVLIDNVPFRVAGVADKKGGFGPSNPDDVIYVPLTVAQEKLFVRRATGLKSVSNIYIETSQTAKAEAVKADITAVLRAQHNLGDAQADDFRLVDQAEIASNLESIATFLTIFLGAVGAISLLVGGIGIMNIMLVSVTERTREIGVRKALGARRINILSQFLVEALTVSAVAGLIGVGFGLAISAAAGNVPGVCQTRGCARHDHRVVWVFGPDRRYLRTLSGLAGEPPGAGGRFALRIVSSHESVDGA
ncbi:MAG: ABC transporter permease [Anaerolineae bacterium]|nr:ABC transporter permease [Anaerolineae bacterium]